MPLLWLWLPLLLLVALRWLRHLRQWGWVLLPVCERLPAAVVAVVAVVGLVVAQVPALAMGACTFGVACVVILEASCEHTMLTSDAAPSTKARAAAPLEARQAPHLHFPSAWMETQNGASK